MYRPRQAPMEPGLRDRRVTVQVRSETTGAFPESDWTTARGFVVPMSLEPLTGREREAFGQVSGAQVVRWEMDYRADMDPERVDVVRERRLVYQGRTYDIRAAYVIGSRLGIALEALAKVG